MDPDVVVEIIQSSKAHSFGARAYDYQIHRLLGKVFAQAGRQRVTGPILIKGPPPYAFEAMPAEPQAQPLTGSAPQGDASDRAADSETHPASGPAPTETEAPANVNNNGEQ